MDMNSYQQPILNFLTDIGINIKIQELPDNTFLPGMTVSNGALLVDPSRVKYPGDLLHEAGHLAVLGKQQREKWDGDFTGAGGYEVAAIAWSYAACVKLGLPVEVLFHDEGYKGEATWLIEIFTNGEGLGLPMLEWLGMARSSGDNAFPKMDVWLCPQA